MVRTTPATTAVARMMFTGVLRVMDGTMYPSMKHSMYSMAAAGQSTTPWMMNTTEALMFVSVPIRIFNALISWNGPVLAVSSTARAEVPVPTPK